jgi:hypothetical protein
MTACVLESAPEHPPEKKLPNRPPPLQPNRLQKGGGLNTCFLTFCSRFIPVFAPQVFRLHRELKGKGRSPCLSAGFLPRRFQTSKIICLHSGTHPPAGTSCMPHHVFGRGVAVAAKVLNEAWRGLLGHPPIASHETRLASEFLTFRQSRAKTKRYTRAFS